MAGSKIFLEPILAETVNGVQGAIDDVVTVLDPVPEKIDEQISMLTRVANAIGTSLNNPSVTDGDLYKFDLVKPTDVRLEVDEVSAGDYYVTKDYTSTFHSYVSGTFSIVIPKFTTLSRIQTFDGEYSGGYNYVTLDYELERNGTTVKTGNLYLYSFENGTRNDYLDPMTEHEAVNITNITCDANDEFVLTITAKANDYMKGLAVLVLSWNDGIVTAGYNLVNTVDNGIIVQG